MQNTRTLPREDTQKSSNKLCYELQLFRPIFNPDGDKVNHIKAKPRTIASKNNIIRFVMPICMDRVSGDQLFSPDNLLTILRRLRLQFIGKKVELTIVPTGELNGWNIFRKARGKLTLAEARLEGRRLAEIWVTAITPHLELMKNLGMKVAVRHWDEFIRIDNVKKLDQHLHAKYDQVHPQLVPIVDFALSNFFLRQNERIPYAEATFANKGYILEELAFITNISLCNKSEFDYHLYEHDELSPKLAAAAIDCSNNLFSGLGFTQLKMSDFMLEYKLGSYPELKFALKRQMKNEMLFHFYMANSTDEELVRNYINSLIKHHIIVDSPSADINRKILNLMNAWGSDNHYDTYFSADTPLTLWSICTGRDCAADHHSLHQIVFDLSNFTNAKESLMELEITVKYRLSKDDIIYIIPMRSSPTIDLHVFKFVEEIISKYKMKNVMYFGMSEKDVLLLRDLISHSKHPDSITLDTSVAEECKQQKVQLQEQLFKIKKHFIEEIKSKPFSVAKIGRSKSFSFFDRPRYVMDDLKRAVAKYAP
jgi:hypothetical protein